MMSFVLLWAAQPVAANDRLAGTWNLERSASDDINAAINETVRKMNVLVRSVARNRLRKTNPAYSRITIAFTATDARISAGPGEPVVLPLSGKAIRWKRSDGEVFTVSGSMRGGSFVETFEAKDGRRTNSFSLGGDRLMLNVSVTSPRLPSPLRYRLVYRRS